MSNIYIQLGAALLSALVLSFAATPAVKWFAQKVGAIDVPADETRMHDHPIPRLGGLAIFLGFLLSVVVFADINKQVQGILLGAVIVVIIGAIDDIVTLKWYIKLPAQLAAALVAVFHGVVINALSNPNIFSANEYLTFGGAFSVVITVFWIIGITNAVNLLDGLDGLACGVSAISSVATLVISMFVSDLNIAVITAALAGACLGFLPHNFNPAKIFMGDSGAYLLGFILATLSITGLFKFYAIISFAVPFLVLGLPLFDTSFAFIRRILSGHNPMHRDRGHFHHRLIDSGLSQKQAVAVLYAVSIVLGLTAVVITTNDAARAAILIAALLIASAIAFFAFRGKFKKLPSTVTNDVTDNMTESGAEQNTEENDKPQ